MTKEEKKVIYISKILELKLINKSAYTKEVDGKVLVVNGSSVQFQEGKYETSNSEEIKFLDNHPNCGGVFIRIPDSVKDIKKEQEKQRESLDDREKREKALKEAGVKKGKQLEEGSSIPNKGKKSKSKKSEKPAF